MPSKDVSPEMLARLSAVMRNPAALRRLGVSMTREVRKVVGGFQALQDDEMREARKAFQSADSVAGEALVAFHEGRYERAANRVLRGLRQELEGTGRIDDMPLAMWILKRGRELLPEEGVSGQERARQQRVVEEADELLAIVRAEDWKGVREHVRALAETYPGAFRRLVESRSGRAFQQRMLASAYRLVLETKNYHWAGEMVRLVDESREVPRPFPTVGVCPHCLPGYLVADREMRDDPWWLLKRVTQEVRGIDPGEVREREEALLMAISAVHVAQHLRRKEQGTPEDFVALAERLLERVRGLPCARKSSSRIPAEYLEGATEVYLGLAALGRRDYDGAKGHWTKAEKLAVPMWSDEAEEQREALADFEVMARKERETYQLEEGVKAAHASGDEAGELEGLERFRGIGGDLSEEQELRCAYLRVALGRSRDPGEVEKALRGQPGDARVSVATWRVAGEISDEGHPADALRLLRRLGPMESWTEDQIRRCAEWAGQAGWAREKAGALSVLATRDPSCVAPAVEALVEAGDHEGAAKLILEDVRAGRPDPVHRKEVYEAALAIRGMDAMEAAAHAYIEAAPGDPDTEEARRRLRMLTEKRTRETTLAASLAAAKCAEKGDWAGAETALKGIPREYLGDETVGLLGKALEMLARPQEAAAVYGERASRVEYAVAAARCWLKAGKPGKALGALENLSREAEGTPPWLSVIVAGKDRDLAALAWLAVGRAAEALRCTSDPAVLENIVFRAKEAGDMDLEMTARGRLHDLGHLPRLGVEELRKLRDLAPLGRKMAGGPSLAGEKRLVLCDTNVLIDLLVSKGDVPWLGGKTEVARRYAELARGENTMAVPSIVEAEFLARVSSPEDTEVSDDVVDEALERAERLVEGLALGRVQGAGVRPGRQHRKRAEVFFAGHADQLARLTEEKARARPSREERIRERRKSVPTRDGSGEGALPETGDVWLLASALRLLEIPVAGISSVAIFSDDRDFRDLRGPLKEAFGIEVL